MRRRGFLKAMVAAAAGLLAVTPRLVRSLQAGTLTKGWTKEEEAAWKPWNEPAFSVSDLFEGKIVIRDGKMYMWLDGQYRLYAQGI